MAPPSPVAKNRDAFAEWKRVTTALRVLGIVTTVDRGALAMMCQLYADWIEAERQLLATGGAVIEGRGGGAVRNPWLLCRNRAVELYMRAASEFGMTPVSRPRLGPPTGMPTYPNEPDAPQDDFDHFLASRPGPLPH